MIESTRRRRLYTILLIAFIVAIIVLIYFLFFYTPKSTSLACFKGYMEKCSRTTYVNEEPQASWGYRILGSSGGQCLVKVTLLQAKEGELNLNLLNGETMVCSYPKGTFAYPEEDLSKCHGILKEEIQDLIINRLHTTILENLGKFDTALETI